MQGVEERWLEIAAAGGAFRERSLAGSIAGKTINVFDAQTEKHVWTLDGSVQNLGSQSSGVVITPDGRKAYVSNFGDSRVAVTVSRSATVR